MVLKSKRKTVQVQSLQTNIREDKVSGVERTSSSESFEEDFFKLIALALKSNAKRSFFQKTN